MGYLQVVPGPGSGSGCVSVIGSDRIGSDRIVYTVSAVLEDFRVIRSLVQNTLETTETHSSLLRLRDSSSSSKNRTLVSVVPMNKIIEFGRKAIFYVRVLSGYEERRIRSYRLQLQQRLQEAQERKMALRKIPEQTILSEVRRMVEEMQTLNRKLEETETAIEEYFKPIDKEAQYMMDIQLKGEEKNMKEMVKLMQEQAMAEKATQEMAAQGSSVETNQHNQDKPAKSTNEG